MRGTVLQVSAKASAPGERGIPKRPLAEARITADGVVGDHNVYRTRKLAGEADSALLVMTLETLLDLHRDGWAVQPGDLGENVLTRGLPYGAMAPGTRLRLGEVEAQVSRACQPCTTLYELPYVGPERGPGFLKATLHRRGWYARVTRAGMLRPGDAAEILP